MFILLFCFALVFCGGGVYLVQFLKSLFYADTGRKRVMIFENVYRSNMSCAKIETIIFSTNTLPHDTC